MTKDEFIKLNDEERDKIKDEIKEEKLRITAKYNDSSSSAEKKRRTK